MKHFILAFTILSIFSACTDQKTKNETDDTPMATTDSHNIATFYLLRHAEKVRTDPNNPDPALSIEGMLRAKRWAAYFEPITIDAIYVTKYIRTKQTISLIAQQKQISPQRYDPNTIYSEDFLKLSNGKNILIAGHSNTIPQLVNKLIGEERFTDMDDADNSTLFIVTFDGNSKDVKTVIVN